MQVLPRIGTGEEEGFTLIELLVVIIIIGILAAIAIPVFLNQRQRAAESSLKSDLRNTAQFMETYYVSHTAYPTDIATLQADVDNDLKFGQHNTVTITAAGAVGGTYCLVATSTQVTGSFSYDSDQGGLLRRNVACS